MCVANLNVALQPCSHRWYTLVKPCASGTNLSNCSEKIKLEGWETRNETCPWCHSGTVLDDATHKLFGNSVSRGRADSDGMSASPRRDRRTSSGATSSSSLSRSSSRSVELEDPDDLDPGAKARMMNYRINYYMFRNPEREDWIKKDEEIAIVGEPELDPPTVTRRGSKLGKTWKKSIKLGRGMFKA